MVARMPAKKDYPYRWLYRETKHLFSNVNYEFIKKSHTYFGMVREIALFSFHMYVYVDENNGLIFGRRDHEKDKYAYQKLALTEKISIL